MTGHMMECSGRIAENYLSVINQLPEPKLVWLEEWEEQELFLDKLDK